MLSGMSGALEISGASAGLLDDDLVLRVRGAGAEAEVTWRARYRDDDGRVWRAAAARPEELMTRFVPAKPSAGPIAALRSLRPLSIDVRAETGDGRGAGRTITRRFTADGVRTRRWRDGLTATLHLPAASTASGDPGAAPGARRAEAHEPPARATLLIDATAGAAAETVAALAAPLLASRGVPALVVGPARGRSASADPIAVARERLAALPAAAGDVVVLPALDPFGPDATAAGIVLPPGAGARDPQPAAAARAVARAVAWDALLHRLGAVPRERAATPPHPG